jgi:hypothetical protein
MGTLTSIASVNWIIHIPYTKLHCNEIMMMFALYCTNTLVGVFVVLVHCNNYLRVDMSADSRSLFKFRDNQLLLLLLRDACVVEKLEFPILWSLVWLNLRSQLRLLHVNRYKNKVVHHASMLTTSENLSKFYNLQNVPWSLIKNTLVCMASFSTPQPLLISSLYPTSFCHCVIAWYVSESVNIDDFKYKPPDCTCASSPFIYNPTGHVITGDLKIINNLSTRVASQRS